MNVSRPVVIGMVAIAGIAAFIAIKKKKKVLFGTSALDYMYEDAAASSPYVPLFKEGDKVDVMNV